MHRDMHDGQGKGPIQSIDGIDRPICARLLPKFLNNEVLSSLLNSAARANSYGISSSAGLDIS